MLKDLFGNVKYCPFCPYIPKSSQEMLGYGGFCIFYPKIYWKGGAKTLNPLESPKNILLTDFALSLAL